MTAFAYRDGALCAEGVRIADIAAAVGTPFYCTSSAALTGAYRAFADALAGALPGLAASVCYAVKANDNLAVLRTLAAEGAGADVVSAGELRRALASGIPARRIVFSGVGKTRVEMGLALDAGIRQFNIESEPELAVLSEVAAARGTRARIALRVNPDVDAETHEKITTGRHHDKFGVEIGRAAEILGHAASLPGIEPVGIALHIGSQITRLEPYRRAFTRVARLVGELRGAGHRIASLDLGGGLGIDYGGQAPPSPAAYGALIGEVFAGIGCDIIIEPGRAIAGPAGVLVAAVLFVKTGATRRFVIVDAAMNDLIRPALYGAHHPIVPVIEPAADAPTAPVDVVGPVCETGDMFARDLALPALEPGALVAFLAAGAYGAVMASSYNARPLAPEVLVAGDRFAMVRRRPSFEDTVALEVLPNWLAAPARSRARGKLSL